MLTTLSHTILTSPLQELERSLQDHHVSALTTIAYHWSQASGRDRHVISSLMPSVWVWAWHLIVWV